MEFDLVGQAQPGAVGLQLLLQHDFRGGLLAGLGVLGDEAVCEAAFPQKTAFQVLPHDLGAVDAPHMLVEEAIFLGFLLARSGSRALVVSDAHFLFFKI